jgi:small GTP-binding protein
MAGTRENGHLVKAYLLGDSGVGKSCLLSTEVDGKYSDDLIRTTGVDFRLKKYDSLKARDASDEGAPPIQAQFWDMPFGGSRGVNPTAISACHLFYIVYDVTDRESFENVTNHLHAIERYGRENAKIILIGNKLDKPGRAIETEEGQKLADKYSLPFFEVSAKTGVNVHEAFRQGLTDAVLQKMPKLEKLPSPAVPKPSLLRQIGGVMGAFISWLWQRISLVGRKISGSLAGRSNAAPIVPDQVRIRELEERVRKLEGEK